MNALTPCLIGILSTLRQRNNTIKRCYLLSILRFAFGGYVFGLRIVKQINFCV